MKRILQLFSAKTFLFEILVYQPEYYGRWPQETSGCLMLIRFPSVNKTNGRSQSWRWVISTDNFVLQGLRHTLQKKTVISSPLKREVVKCAEIISNSRILSSFWSQVLFLLFYKLAVFRLPHNSYNLLSLSRNNVLEIFFHNE